MVTKYIKSLLMHVFISIVMIRLRNILELCNSDKKALTSIYNSQKFIRKRNTILATGAWTVF